jgi:DNA-binding NarL/FixJ family response regulator
MLSNVSDEKYVNQALEMGAVSYLIKGNLTPADVVKEIKDKLIALGKQTLVTNKA